MVQNSPAGQRVPDTAADLGAGTAAGSSPLPGS